MGKPIFTLSGQTVHGKHLGTRLGFPTANIAYGGAGRKWPRNGAYIATARIGDRGKHYIAVLNQGHHPTSPEGQPTVEVHLLHYEGGDLYGQELTLWYQKFLRAEEKFSSLEALQAQLEKDVKAAEAWAKGARVAQNTKK